MRNLLVLAAVTGVTALVACVSDSTSTIDPCVSWCDAVFTNCTGGLEAFKDREQCNQMCKFIPTGADGVDEDTVQCRTTHARKAAEPGADKTKECHAASAYGGGVCGSDAKRVFCKRVESICIKPLPPGLAAPPYPSEADCEEAKITFDPNASEGTQQDFQGADTINCRMNHLILALDARSPHCSHTALTSDTCK